MRKDAFAGGALLCVLGATLPGCADTTTHALDTGPSARAELSPTQGNAAAGSATFTRKGDMVQAEIKASGLAPGSIHGIHIHETGDCSAPDASSAGAHFDPTTAPHGGPAGELRHGGDLGNITADAEGNAGKTVDVAGISVEGGPDRIQGRAVVLHAAADDLTSQPAGNSGGRIACGVINPADSEAG